jgi:hypothetical protein
MKLHKIYPTIGSISLFQLGMMCENINEFKWYTWIIALIFLFFGILFCYYPALNWFDNK